MHILLKKNENKYLVLALTKNNKKEVLKPHIRPWNWIEKQTKTINNNEYKNRFIKIRTNSQDNLPLERKLCLFISDIFVESVFQIKDECYLL